MVFPGQLIHARKIVDFLVGLHLGNAFRKNCYIRPEDIPVFARASMLRISWLHLVDFLLFKRQFEIKQVFRHPSNYEVLCIRHVNQKAFFIFEFRVVSVIFDAYCFRKPPVSSISTFLLLFLLFPVCNDVVSLFFLEFFVGGIFVWFCCSTLEVFFVGLCRFELRILRCECCRGSV